MPIDRKKQLLSSDEKMGGPELLIDRSLQRDVTLNEKSEQRRPGRERSHLPSQECDSLLSVRNFTRNRFPGFGDTVAIPFRGGGSNQQFSKVNGGGGWKKSNL